jgi:hypothetical protein
MVIRRILARRRATPLLRPPTVPPALAAQLDHAQRTALDLADRDRAWLNDPRRPDGCVCGCRALTNLRARHPRATSATPLFHDALRTTK